MVISFWTKRQLERDTTYRGDNCAGCRVVGGTGVHRKSAEAALSRMAVL